VIDLHTHLLPGVDDGFVTARALTTGIPAGRVKVVMVDQDKGGARAAHSHEGEEAILMLKGEAEVNVANETFILRTGDCLHYSAKVEHSAVFTGDGRNKALWVTVKPGALRW